MNSVAWFPYDGKAIHWCLHIFVKCSQKIEN